MDPSCCSPSGEAPSRPRAPRPLLIAGASDGGSRGGLRTSHPLPRPCRQLWHAPPSLPRPCHLNRPRRQPRHASPSSGPAVGRVGTRGPHGGLHPGQGRGAEERSCSARRRELLIAGGFVSSLSHRREELGVGVRGGVEGDGSRTPSRGRGAQRREDAQGRRKAGGERRRRWGRARTERGEASGVREKDGVRWEERIKWVDVVRIRSMGVGGSGPQHSRGAPTHSCVIANSSARGASEIGVPRVYFYPWRIIFWCAASKVGAPQPAQSTLYLLSL